MKLPVRLRLDSGTGDSGSSRLETDLRHYYDTLLDDIRQAAVRRRLNARVSQAITAQRLAAAASPRFHRLLRLPGPHLAAIVCAGAAIFAFGHMTAADLTPAHTSVPPTSAPLNGRVQTFNGNARLSMTSSWHVGSLARPV